MTGKLLLSLSRKVSIINRRETWKWNPIIKIDGKKAWRVPWTLYHGIDSIIITFRFNRIKGSMHKRQ